MQTIETAMLTILRSLTRLQKRTITLFIDVLLVVPAILAASSLAADAELGGDRLAMLQIVALWFSWKSGLCDMRVAAIGAQMLALMAAHAAFLGATLILFEALASGSWNWAPATLFALVYFSLGTAIRLVIYGSLTILYRKSSCERIMIYGAGSAGAEVLHALNSFPAIDIVGFLSTDEALVGLSVLGLRVHALDELPQLLRGSHIDRVIIAENPTDAQRREDLRLRIEALGVETSSPPTMPENRVDVSSTILDPCHFLQRYPQNMRLGSGPTCYAGQSIMVTGAGGTIGSELVRQLIDLGPAKLVLVDHAEHALYEVHRQSTSFAGRCGIRIVPVLASVADFEAMSDACQSHEIDTVFHAAAYKHVPMLETNGRSALRNNVLGTETLLKVCQKYRVTRFLLISSDKAVHPKNVMGASKLIAEQIVRGVGLRHTRLATGVVRFGNVLGSSGSVVPLFLEQARRQHPVTVTHPDAERFFMSVDEAVGLVLQAGAIALKGDVFTLDMGAPVRIAELAQRVIDAEARARSPVSAGPVSEIIFTGLRAGEKLREELSYGHTEPSAVHPKILHAPEEPQLSEIETARLLRSLRDMLDAGQTIHLDMLLDALDCARSRREVTGDMAVTPPSPALA